MKAPDTDYLLDPQKAKASQIPAEYVFHTEYLLVNLGACPL